MTIRLWSDLHISHFNLATKWRAWAGGDVPSHNEYIKEVWNRTVKPSDVVYIVGDACMGILTESLEFCKGLRGEIHLIPGNHDRFHPSYHHKNEEKAAQQRALYEEVFILEQPTLYGDALGLSDPYVVINHHPWAGTPDHDESDREYLHKHYLKQENFPVGTVLIHGHTHSSRVYEVPMAVHVGVDTWPEGPVELELIQQLIEGARRNGQATNSA